MAQPNGSHVLVLLGQLKFIHEGGMKVVSWEPPPTKQSHQPHQAVRNQEKGDKGSFAHAFTCSINILSMSYLEEGPSSSSSNFIHFAPIGVGSYRHLIMLSDDDSNGKDEDLFHLISLLNMSRGHSLCFRL